MLYLGMRLFLPAILFAVFFTAASVPLHLEKHSWRQFDDTPYNDTRLEIPVLYNHVFDFRFYEDYLIRKNNTGQSRFLFWARDSVNFGDIDFLFRCRADQKDNAADAAYVDEEIPFSIDMDRILMSWNINNVLSLKLGKDRFNWGPLKLGGLLVSDYHQGFNMVMQEYKLGPFLLKGFFTQINSVAENDAVKLYEYKHSSVPDSIEITLLNRFYSAARLEFIKKRYGIGIGQAVIYAGENRNFELQYCMPFYPFHYGQMSVWREGNSYDNTFGSVDFFFIPADSVKIYAEILVDDIQVEFDEVSQSIQNSVAFMVGFETSGRDFSLFLEGGRINSFVYNHAAGQRLSYTNEKGFMGSPLGPDAELLYGEGSYLLKNGLKTSVGLWFMNKGERNIEYEIQKMIKTREDKVPYGTVYKERNLWVSLEKTFFNSFSLEISTGILNNFNMGNLAGNDESTPFLRIGAGSGIRTGN
ncbi:MAG: capsule assembly Wzi family protein [Fibrobacterota bacterium]